ncbi:MAG: alpha/beta fold hydrolase [Saprospiraceae bacterium]|nr:alpha/beta fold hydrolase [Saprospiraceae bacterium]
MDLNFKTFGQGDPLVILHGLFGTLDNWQTLGKSWAEFYSVYLIDQRNHGRSPHLPEINYPVLATDLQAFLESHWIYKTHLIGHSMGGKTAMQFATSFPDMVEKLVIIDSAPKKYAGGHQLIFEALFDLDLANLENREQADLALQSRIPEKDVRQFLLKNLTRNKQAPGYSWKMNLPVLFNHYADILANIQFDQPFEGPCLFIRGGHSDYIQDQDIDAITRIFPNARLETIAGAGHWVHAEKPKELYQLVSDFLAE